MLWGINKSDLPLLIAQKSPSGLLVFEDSSSSLLSQVIGEVFMGCDPLHQGCGAMDVEVVGQKDPLGFWIGGDGLLTMCQKVIFLSACADGRGDQFSGGKVEIGDQALGGMTDVLMLEAGGFTRSGPQVSPYSLLGLNARLFICAHYPNPFLAELGGSFDQAVDLSDFRFKNFKVLNLGRKPVFTAVRLKYVFLK